MPQAVAHRYAQALADAILAPGSGADPGEIAGQLHRFEEMFRSVSELRNILLSPAVTNERKRAVIGRLADALPLARQVRNFLYVIVDRRRGELLSEIAEAFDAALDERLGFVRAHVTSAAALSERQQSELERALSDVTGKRVRCDFNVDTALIGGVVARIGSTIYDGSVRMQLQTMRQALVS